MKLKYLKTTVSAVCLAGMLGAAGSANALTLTQANAGIPGGGPYGTVTVTFVNATTANVVFTASSAGGFNYSFGGTGAIGLNVNATTFTGTATGATAHPGGAGVLGSLSNGGAGNEDGWGSFNYTIDDFDGFGHSMTSISLTLVNTSGSWASAADVLTANASGHFAAAHIFTGDANWNSVGSLTGFATDGGPVPDAGSTMALVGVALAGLGLLRRKLS